MQVMFRKRATNHRALLREITCRDNASCWSSPPCHPNDFSKVSSTNTWKCKSGRTIFEERQIYTYSNDFSKVSSSNIFLCTYCVHKHMNMHRYVWKYLVPCTLLVLSSFHLQEILKSQWPSTFAQYKHHHADFSEFWPALLSAHTRMQLCHPGRNSQKSACDGIYCVK